MSAGHDKAQRYISLLDTARANANWNELPELIRKVTKHAPQRKCLIRTATIESEIVKHLTSGGRRSNQNDSSIPNFTTQLSALKDEVSSTQNDEDRIQGQTCLLWAAWANEKRTDASADNIHLLDTMESSSGFSLWTKVCLVKAAYIQGVLHRHSGRKSESKESFQAGMTWINANIQQVLSSPQLVYWSKQLMAQTALSVDNTFGSHQQSNLDLTRLYAFRRWALLFSKSKDTSTSSYGHVTAHILTQSMWKAYYDYLSRLIEFETAEPAKFTDFPRSEQAVELRQVETFYENELLRNTRFPQATESNIEIEDWVEQVIRNWHNLCGFQWSEADLGEGGRNAMGRNVLDILYRAATKTFHSTLILRRLFQVHKSLADFDLAYNALDTYVELVERAITRAAKSKEANKGKDNNEIIMRTISEGIKGLCAFGRPKEAEKAFNLCLRLEGFLKELDSRKSLGTIDNEEPLKNGFGELHGQDVSPETRNIVYRSLGVGKAQWARWTPFNENRSSLQLQAVNYLKSALNQPLQTQQQLETLYALSLLLAETREIDQSIEYIKKALSCDSSIKEADDHQFLKRKLIPFWHLLALLLSSRQDFDTAWQSCIAAFDQFSSPAVLFGHNVGPDSGSQKRGTVKHDFGLVDDMECIELQRIIEIRTTELALTEIAEGSEHAVNSSNELLGLYSRLFHRLGVSADEKPSAKVVEPPKSSAGTIKSFTGSLFGRKKFGRSSQIYNEGTNGTVSAQNSSAKINNRRPITPAIHVTDEDNKALHHKNRLFRHSHDTSEHEKPRTLTKRVSASHIARSNSKQKKSERPISHASSQRQSFETSQETAPSSTGSVETAQPHLDIDTAAAPSTRDIPEANLSEDHNSSPQAKQPLKGIPSNLASPRQLPHPEGHDSQSPQQDIRLPTVNSKTNATSPAPISRFPKIASQKHALSILVKIWLVIAVLYRRGNMLDDSREACDEAAKVAMKIESLVASVESSARSFADPGWGGGGKSSDQIWADVHCERAELLLTTARLRQEKPKKLDPEDEVNEDKEEEIDHETVRQAVEHFEQCLMYFPDHPGGIVGLSNVLLDYYERKVELGRKVEEPKITPSTTTTIRRSSVPSNSSRPKRRPNQDPPSTKFPSTSDASADPFSSSLSTSPPHQHRPQLSSSPSFQTDLTTTTIHNHHQHQANLLPTSNPGLSLTEDQDLKKTPENLNRLAARDRAYGLLSVLTKSGLGWDNAEAWFALARAHELGSTTAIAAAGNISSLESSMNMTNSATATAITSGPGPGPGPVGGTGGGEDKIKEILWWCVELEDTRPIRHWRNVSGGWGSYIL